MPLLQPQYPKGDFHQLVQRDLEKIVAGKCDQNHLQHLSGKTGGRNSRHANNLCHLCPQQRYIFGWAAVCGNRKKPDYAEEAGNFTICAVPLNPDVVHICRTMHCRFCICFSDYQVAWKTGITIADDRNHRFRIMSRTSSIAKQT